MIKPIKFDLKLSNGTKLATLDDLEENLTPELFQYFHSGKLAKWLRVRKLEELADKMETLQTEYLEYKNELDVQLFKKLCEIFVSEVDLDDAREAVSEFKALPVVQTENTEEIEESKELMVIEPSKTKEFHLNERLLYKTFMELGGEIKDVGYRPTNCINYAKGETRPSKKLVELLGKYSISIDEVLICYGDDSSHLGSFCILTNHYLMFLGTYYTSTNEFSYNTMYMPNIYTKILLTDICYFNCIDTGCHPVALVNNRIFVSNDSRSFMVFQLVKHYLALEEFEDKVEPIKTK